MFEIERRGYLRAGAFVPEVVLERPEMVKALHEEFVHAGSDVVLAFTVGTRYGLSFVRYVLRGLIKVLKCRIKVQYNYNSIDTL